MTRNAAHPIEPLFVDRWSPRSFTGEPVPDAVLLSAFEAARWAPSASNVQPWRFLLARPGDADWETFVGLLMPRNALWASRASALVVILSELRLERRGVVVDNVSHSFDAGAAWTNFAHQALLLGWHTHGIGGFDREAARTRLAVPDDFAIEAMVAIGRLAGLDTLDPEFHAAEAPNGRRPLDETVFAGRLGAPAFAKERNAA
ncbi:MULTISPECIES: nitroreductase family protein [unclassified Sphingomonas]|uniref:nitroreductase family protein n=1 Tax=unclassified Sphingomonas TaxID=196159 RepID=UPI00092A1B78|nr:MULTISPECIES: nitroreductase family protein [unclassified Sphingomonas]OJU22351.1 MAG: nitroreductase [Sphingomonas sp. 66-10]